MEWCRRLLSNWRGGHSSESEEDSAPQVGQGATSPPCFLTDDGSVARFLFQSRDFRRADGQPKPSAFKPERHPDLDRLETSVCGTHGVGIDRLTELGNTIRAGKQALGYTEVSLMSVARANLYCEPAPEPSIGFLEHCVILGWSDTEDKSAIMAAQQDLATTATPVRLFSTSTAIA